MDDDGSAESGRKRLARGTKPHARAGQGGLADAEITESATPPAIVSHAPVNAPAEVRGSAQATVGGAVPVGMAARGSGPVPAGGAPSGASRAPAQSICEAVEQLIEAQEADEAIAEWMQGGG